MVLNILIVIWVTALFLCVPTFGNKSVGGTYSRSLFGIQNFHHCKLKHSVSLKSCNSPIRLYNFMNHKCLLLISQNLLAAL